MNQSVNQPMHQRPALIMLPGTLCDGRVFAHQRRALRDVADVHTLDYRQLRHLDDWVPALLDRLPPRFSLAGFSLGGLWALEIVRQAPHRVERLALIASNARAASPKGRRHSEGLWRLWKQRGPRAVVQQALPNYFHHVQCRRAHTALVTDMAVKTRTPAARAEFAWAASRPAGLPALAAFDGPVLLASGQQDRLCPPPWQQAMHLARPDAQWLELPRVGHFLPLEAPARLSQAMRLWMQR